MDHAVVCARVRPLSSKEKEANQQKVVKCGKDDKITVGEKIYPVQGFGSDVHNEAIYSSGIKNTIQQALSRGINTAVLLVGESKSGKTMTLNSSVSGNGIVSQICDDIFEHVSQKSSYVGVTYLNVYHDIIMDLLNPSDKHIKVRNHGDLGDYLENAAELSVKSTPDVLRLFHQGSKIRKVVELEKGIPSTKSHTVFIISTEYKMSQDSVIRSRIVLCNVAGLNHRTDDHVKGALSALDTVLTDLSGSSGTVSGYNGSKLTQILRSVLNKNSFLHFIGHLGPTTASSDINTRTLELLQKAELISLTPTPSDLNLQKIIAGLRRKVAAARTAITSVSNVNIPKEHIAELEHSLGALTSAKRMQWQNREVASMKVEEERKVVLADKGILEWVTEAQKRSKDTDGKIVALQKEKDTLVGEYKTQRKIVDDLKNELQGNIARHTKLAEEPSQSETVLQESLAAIHKLRDQLSAGNEKLKDLKKGVKDVQDKLKIERTLDVEAGEDIQGNFELSYVVKGDEYRALKKDNVQFMEEEKDRLQMEAEQTIAEAKLSASQGKMLTVDQMIELQEELANVNSQLSHLALHVQCLEAEREKLEENVECLRSAHRTEAEAHKMRNLLTFRQFKDYYEEAKTANDHKYRELLNSCVQDCVFLSSKNSELEEEVLTLKKKMKS